MLLSKGMRCDADEPFEGLAHMERVAIPEPESDFFDWNVRVEQVALPLQNQPFFNDLLCAPAQNPADDFRKPERGHAQLVAVIADIVARAEIALQHRHELLTDRSFFMVMVRG